MSTHNQPEMFIAQRQSEAEKAKKKRFKEVISFIGEEEEKSPFNELNPRKKRKADRSITRWKRRTRPRRPPRSPIPPDDLQE